jgi:hypothetical protein
LIFFISSFGDEAALSLMSRTERGPDWGVNDVG